MQQAKTPVLRCHYITSTTAGNTSGSRVCPTPQDTCMTLCLLEQLVNALRANDPDTFKGWLSGGVQGLGKPVVDSLFFCKSTLRILSVNINTGFLPAGLHGIK